jgi:cytochrome c oxidase cbb3-type subunit III
VAALEVLGQSIPWWATPKPVRPTSMVPANALQNAILSGEHRGEFVEVSKKTVTVTLPTGQVVQGKLYQIDDFVVSLIDANGDYHSYPRHGAVPKVVVTDPLQPHLDMLQTLKDDDIHNLTAYLVTLK